MASRDGTRPNILFILSDDQGIWANGCYGNREIITPNIDRLAEEGTRFDDFFCASPVCSPARASILTGKIPSQHGVQDWIREGNLREGAIDYLDGVTALTDVLAQHGYRCGISGKWHLGNSFVPQKSFSHWYVHQKGSGNYYNAPMVRDGQAVQEPGYVTDLITDDAIQCLEEYSKDDVPFYLSVHYTAPHNPWNEEQHPAEYRRLYEDCPFESAKQEPWHPEATFRYSAEDARRSLIGYYASITAMDANIGRLLDKLEETGLREDTIVLFTSDNGYMCGQHGIWGKGNGTFSLNMYDEAVKVPMIISHPGTVPSGRVSEELFSHYDLMPTLLDYVSNGAATGLYLAVAACIERRLGKRYYYLSRAEVAQMDTMDDVFKCTVYLDDLSKWGRFNEIYLTFFPEPRPVRTAIQAGLLPGFQVEVELWAAKA